MKTLIIDSYTLFREGLCHVLSALDEKMIILQSAEFDEVLKNVTEHADLDMVLLGMHMPAQEDYLMLARIVQRYPALPVVMLSGSNRFNDVQRALNAGAAGYIPKNTSVKEMQHALQLVLAGDIYVPESMTLDDNHIC